MSKDGVAPRRGAVAVLGAVLGDKIPVSQLPELDLPPADAARAMRLALTVMRHLDAADAVLLPYLRKTPPMDARNILRLGVVEMVVEKAAAHGVVNAAVHLAREERGTTAAAGLINAVLRKVSEQEQPFAGMPLQRMPKWLRQPLVQLWGRDIVNSIEAVQTESPPLDLTLKSLASMPGNMPGAVRLPTGSLRLSGSVQVSTLPGFAEGMWWVQDAAAALPARVLDAKPGERVLDLCAAPGGKTMQLAATGAAVTALDISGPRLERLRENLARTGLQAEIITADALHWQPEELFDAVLLDAPCSASGTLRRHPDLAFVKDGSDLAALTALQAQLIDRALTFLKPGGRLVFATCSLLPAEGEAQLTAALARHPGLRLERADVKGLDPDWFAPAGGLRLLPSYLPGQGGMDGFFVARLRASA